MRNCVLVISLFGFLSVCCEACRSKKIVQYDRAGETVCSQLISVDKETSVVFPAHFSPLVGLSLVPADSMQQCPAKYSGSLSKPETLLIRQRFREVRQDTTTTSATITTTQSRHPEVPLRPSWWPDVRTALIVLALAVLVVFIAILFRRPHPS